MSNKAKKKKYKIVNWKEYNQALVDRGDFTLWISEEVIEQGQHVHKESKVGRSFAL